MSRLDEIIADLTSSRRSRRQFMQQAAALGLIIPVVSKSMLGSLIASAQEGRKSVKWLSPRSSLAVLENYPYWVALKLGYFEDLEVSMDPTNQETASSSKVVSDGGGDVSYISPGGFAIDVAEGLELVSVWEMGAFDAFDIALPKGNPGRISTPKDLEGKKVVVGDLRWAEIVNPIVAQAGGDHSKVQYFSAGTGWGHALAEGQADAALSWAGLRAQWLGIGLDFNYILGKSWSKFPSSSFQIRRADYEDPSLVELYTDYLRGWAMGLEFGHQNPRAATQITMESEPISAALNATFPDKNIAVQSMWQLADVFRGDWPTRNGGQWGWHSMESWEIFLKTIKDIGQLTKDIKAEDIIFNDYVAGGNEFDKAKVKADADAFVLSEEFAAVEVPAGAGTDGAYPS